MFLYWGSSVNKIKEFFENQIAELKLALQTNDKESQEAVHNVNSANEEYVKLKVIHYHLNA